MENTDVCGAAGADLRHRLLGLSRLQKRLLQIVVDVLLVWLTLWLAFFLRLGEADHIQPFSGHAWLFILAPMLALPMFVRFGLYRAVMRYAGFQALATVARAMTAAAALLGLAIYLYGPSPVFIPRSTVIIYWMLGLLLIGGLRIGMRYYFSGVPFSLLMLAFSNVDTRPDSLQRVAIYGAGAAGNQLLMALRMGDEMTPVAFIDDELGLAGRFIGGVPVYASNNLGRMLQDTGAREVLLAIPSASRIRRSEIIDELAPYPLHVRTVPGIMDLASGRVKVEDLREIDVDDLLGRGVVKPDVSLFERCIRGQVVMVTGAGGSIGSELCRQIMQNGPRTLILFEHSEYNLYAIESEMNTHAGSTSPTPSIIPILGSVRNQRRLFDVMSTWQVDTVYHAAAYKHVPMVEKNISEGLRNNVFGTLNAAQAALRAGVKNFVLISTDKAVRPTNIMGSTKRLAEMVLQALAAEATPILILYDIAAAHPTLVENHTRFTMVRFGNVLDSSGSVIPLFREQIRQGGPITVTHPEITRYFMTIPEAAQLVIQAGSMGEGGDVFVLDMGKPMKINQLAEKMVFLSGLSLRSASKPDGDIAITFTGLRPGEKLYEELLIGDNVTATEHPMIMRANENHLDWDALKSVLDQLWAAVDDDNYPHIRELFHQFVDGYTPDEEIVDWIHQQRAAANTNA